MNKLYTRQIFNNDAAPALNETNLNILTKAVSDIDDRVVAIADDVIESVPQLLELAETIEPNVERAEQAAEDAEEYAAEAAAGSGGNALEYTNSKLKLKRDSVVLSEVTISGGSGGTVDENFSTTSTNALMNKTITNDVTDRSFGREKVVRITNWGGTWGLYGYGKFGSTTTLQDIVTYLNTNRVKADKVIILSNANDNAYTQSLAMSEGCITEIVPNADGYVDGYWTRGYIRQTVSNGNRVFTKTFHSGTWSNWVEELRPSNVYGSDVYSSTTTYAIGSCCIYENALYKAIQDNIVGVVPTNTTYWEKVTLASVSKEVYSTDEVKTNKIWIDGKPIYRKVINTTLPITTTDGTMAVKTLTSELSGVGTIIGCSGIFYYGSPLTYQPFPAINNAINRLSKIYVTGTTLCIAHNFSSWNGANAHIVVEYIK